MFVSSRVDVDHQISHTTPEAAAYGFQVKNDTKLVSTGSVQTNILSTVELEEITSNGFVADGLCNAECDANDDCVGWNLLLSSFQCSLIGLVDSEMDGLVPVAWSASPGTRAGLKDGARTHSPGCGCLDAADTSTCYKSSNLEGFGVVEGGVYDPNSKMTREESFSCTALFHTRAGKTATGKTSQSKFIADVERYTVSINHNVEQSTFGYDVSAQDMRGWLEIQGTTDAAQKECRENPTAVHSYNSDSPFGFNGTGGSTNSAPCMIKPHQDREGCDYFHVGTLLTAAGVDLDEIQPGSSHTGRYNGLKIILFIEYLNSIPMTGLTEGAPGNSAGVAYTYKVAALNSQTKVSSESWVKFPVERILFQRCAHTWLADD
jgi:hypothetical protein